jgi:hypothetical protein
MMAVKGSMWTTEKSHLSLALIFLLLLRQSWALLLTATVSDSTGANDVRRSS